MWAILDKGSPFKSRSVEFSLLERVYGLKWQWPLWVEHLEFIVHSPKSPHLHPGGVHSPHFIDDKAEGQKLIK